MSLINDALKRAKQAQDRNAPPLAPGAPLRPVEAAPRKASSSGAIWILLGALLLGLAAAVLILVAIRGGKATPVPGVATEPRPAISTTPAPTVPVPATKPQLSAAPTPKPVAVVTTQPILAPAPVVTTPVVTAPVPPPTIPAETTAPVAATVSNAVVPAPVAAPALPKLQGIFYRPDRPSALLNGKTVLVGGRSGEFLVVKITQQSVTLVRAGETNVVSLAE